MSGTTDDPCGFCNGWPLCARDCPRGEVAFAGASVVLAALVNVPREMRLSALALASKALIEHGAAVHAALELAEQDPATEGA